MKRFIFFKKKITKKKKGWLARGARRSAAKKRKEDPDGCPGEKAGEEVDLCSRVEIVPLTSSCH
jgi:hypothetical protein